MENSKLSVAEIMGYNVAHERKKAKITQEELADILGVSARTIQNYEKGKGLDAVLIYDLSQIFQCNILDFYLGIESTK